MTTTMSFGGVRRAMAAQMGRATGRKRKRKKVRRRAHL
jgi:hypothetical protein